VPDVRASIASTAPATHAPPPPRLPATYQAEADTTTLGGSARVVAYPGASGGSVVRDVGAWSASSQPGTVTFNNVVVATAGSYSLTVYFVDIDDDNDLGLTVTISGGNTVTIPISGPSRCCATKTITVTLAAGSNTIILGNPNGHAPAIDKIVLSRRED
jgi:hypothetical protein